MKLDDAAARLEALGNPTRLKIYRALVEGQVLRQIVREPTLSPSEFDILKQRRASELEELTTEPQGIAPRLVSQKLNPYPKGDVRNQPSLTDELEIVQKMDVGSIKKVYERFLSAQAGELGDPESGG